MKEAMSKTAVGWGKPADQNEGYLYYNKHVLVLANIGLSHSLIWTQSAFRFGCSKDTIVIKEVKSLLFPQLEEKRLEVAVEGTGHKKEKERKADAHTQLLTMAPACPSIGRNPFDQILALGWKRFNEHTDTVFFFWVYFVFLRIDK